MSFTREKSQKKREREMSYPKIRKFVYPAAKWTFFMFLLVGLMSCKSSTSPEDQVAHIRVSNTCGATVDIHVDGVFKKSLDNDSETTFQVVDEGVYILEAYKTGTEISAAYGEVRVYFGGRYSWYVEGPAVIIVTNKYGETLKIHIDGTYLGDLDDTYSEQIDKVTFGVHTVEGKKLNGDVAASITFDVEDAADYFWEIVKEE
jgi:hypothetical protein